MGGDFGYLYLGTGVDFGIVSGGEVQLGATGNVGEIGHLRVADSGSLCPCCGAEGTLGQMVLPASIVRQASEAFGLHGPVAQTPAEIDDQFKALCLRSNHDPEISALFMALGRLGCGHAQRKQFIYLRIFDNA